MSSSASDRAAQVSSAPLSVPTMRDTALRDSGAAWSRGCSAPLSRRVFAPGQVGHRHGRVDLLQPALVARDDARDPLLRPAWREHESAGHGEAERPRRARQRAALVPVPVAAPRRPPLVAPGVQHRGQLLLHRLLDGHADVLVNQLAQGDPLRLLRVLPVSGTADSGHRERPDRFIVNAPIGGR